MLLFLASLLFASTAPIAPQDSTGIGECSNERACNIEAHVRHEGTPQSCGVVLSVLGLDIPLWGDDCYPYRFLHPAHQECHGKRNLGTQCVFEQNVPVLGERCNCERRSGGGSTGFSQWVCPCTLLGNTGTLEDWKTENCPLRPAHGEGPTMGGGL